MVSWILLNKDLGCKEIIPPFALVSVGGDLAGMISYRNIFKGEQSLDVSEAGSKEILKTKINGIFLP